MSDYVVPTTAEVDAAVRRLTSYQLRRVFYEGLTNPNWVKPLSDLSVFTNPPEPEPTGDGYIKDVFWPELSYLQNVAEADPVEVIDVLLGLKATSNAWVRRAAFEIGAKVPSDQAARLKPLVTAWFESGGLGWRTDPRDLVSFAVNLIEGGEKYGVPFANLLFRPRDSENDDIRDPVVELKADWYAQELPRVASALGRSGLKTILPWLTQYERITMSVGDGFDHSGFGRSTVAARVEGQRDIENALIDAVRDLACSDFGTEPDMAWQLFQRNNILIAQRIAMHSVAQVLETCTDVDLSAKLVTIGWELLARPLGREQGARREFVALAKALVAHSSADMLVDLVNQGHFTAESSARIRKSLFDRGKLSEEIDESLRRWDETWRHQVLSGIGRELLPPALQTQLDDLQTSYGVIEGPEADSEFNSWTGPNSPVDQDTMAAMSATELLAHLGSWHHAGDRWASEPSHEGQSRVLTRVLASNPLALGEVTGLVGRLRPTYIRAVLRGWEAAFKADLDLPWDTVLATIAFVVNHGYESEFPIEGGPFDDDPDFREAKRASVGILEEFAKPRNGDRIPANILAQIAVLLIETSVDEVAWNDYASYELTNESGMDPLSTSLNWQWPNMVRGLLHLVSHGHDTSWYMSATEALDRELEREDSRGASRAVVGEALGRLHDGAPEWLDQNFETYFGTEALMDRGQQIALTTAIAIHYYHPALYQRLNGPMIAALRQTDEIAIGWGNEDSLKARIGQWVVQAIIRGHVDLSDPLRVEFYSIGPAGVRGEAMGHVAWSLLRADEVDDVFRDRLAELWDERAAHVAAHPEDSLELKDFYWFVRCGKFEADWWLPRLKQATSIDPELDTHGMIGEQLAKAAPAHPRDTLDVLRLLLKPAETHNREHWDLTHHALAPVLAASLDAGDDQLTRDALKLMNEMGERGETDLDRRVEALREGRPAFDPRNAATK